MNHFTFNVWSNIFIFKRAHPDYNRKRKERYHEIDRENTDNPWKTWQKKLALIKKIGVIVRKIAREQAKPETIHLQSYKGLWEAGADRNQYQYYCHEQGKWIRIKRSHYGLCVRVRYAGIYDSTSHHTGFYYIWSSLSAEKSFHQRRKYFDGKISVLLLPFR